MFRLEVFKSYCLGILFNFRLREEVYVFTGKVWDELNFSLHQISGNQLYRFNTAELSDMTRMIRLGIVSRNVELKFMERSKRPSGRVMELFFTNADADKYNKQCYQELSSSEYTYNSNLMIHLNLVDSNVSSLVYLVRNR